MILPMYFLVFERLADGKARFVQDDAEVRRIPEIKRNKGLGVTKNYSGYILPVQPHSQSKFMPVKNRNVNNYFTR